MKFLLLLALLASVFSHSVELLSGGDAEVFHQRYRLEEPEWQVFHTSERRAIVQLTTYLHGEAGRFINPRAAEGPALAVDDVTDCAEEAEGCVQQFYFRSRDAIDSTQRANGVISVQLETDDPEEAALQLFFSYSIDFADRAQHGSADSVLTVNGIPVLQGGFSLDKPLIEGREACLVVKHDAPITAKSARVCTSLSKNIDALLGKEASCDSLVDDMVTNVMLDGARDYVNALYSPVVRETGNENEFEFCFSPKKLSLHTHLVEVEYAMGGQAKRTLFGFGLPHSFTVECEHDSLFLTTSSECEVTSANSISAWWFVVIVVAVILCCLFAYWAIAYDRPVHFYENGSVWHGQGAYHPHFPGAPRNQNTLIVQQSSESDSEEMTNANELRFNSETKKYFLGMEKRR